MVDQIDELQVSWQKSSHQFNGPFLKSLWEDGMVSVREGVVNNVPSFLEARRRASPHRSEQIKILKSSMVAMAG